MATAQTEERTGQQAKEIAARDIAAKDIAARETAAGASVPHESAALHVSGDATYVDDIAELAGTLYVALGQSSEAHARLRAINLDAVKNASGVVAVLTAADIPGRNDCGPIVQDDPILADGLVQFVGQPIFAVVAESFVAARKAARLAQIEYDILPAVLDVASRLRLASNGKFPVRKFIEQVTETATRNYADLDQWPLGESH